MFWLWTLLGIAIQYVITGVFITIVFFSSAIKTSVGENKTFKQHVHTLFFFLLTFMLFVVVWPLLAIDEINRYEGPL